MIAPVEKLIPNGITHPHFYEDDVYRDWKFGNDPGKLINPFITIKVINKAEQIINVIRPLS